MRKGRIKSLQPEWVIIQEQLADFNEFAWWISREKKWPHNLSNSTLGRRCGIREWVGVCALARGCGVCYFLISISLSLSSLRHTLYIQGYVYIWKCSCAAHHMMLLRERCSLRKIPRRVIKHSCCLLAYSSLLCIFMCEQQQLNPAVSTFTIC